MYRALMHPVARAIWGSILVTILYLVAQSAAGAGAVGALAGLVIIGSAIERKAPSQYGLVWRGAGVHLVVGLGLGAAVICTTIALLWVTGLYKATGFETTPAPLLGILLYLQIAVGEEALFRGVITRVILEQGRPYVALVAGAVLFVFYHGLNPLVDPAFSSLALTAGMAFGAAYIATRSLWLPITMHWAFDGLAGPVFGTRPWIEVGPGFIHSTSMTVFEHVAAAVLFAIIAVIFVRRPGFQKAAPHWSSGQRGGSHGEQDHTGLITKAPPDGRD